ncbi:hypothetical protein [Pleurocapsa sp. PCC 7319]|uniref:hypothetical protein n=1 Tax=Pleurocapsa sp. PCC 7319 TaxID=118161 RepID=UPI000348933D|nr:hypothetical protein [Pleurocapsa sp. PCC 7319]
MTLFSDVFDLYFQTESSTFSAESINFHVTENQDSSAFEVKGNFSGTEGNDNIVDNSLTISHDNFQGLQGNDIIVGGLGNDVILGGEGNDTLSGAGANIVSNTGEVGFFANSSSEGNLYGQDTLTGGQGLDVFVLGDPNNFNNIEGIPVRTNYYNGAGNDDYALITDFNQSEDLIHLNGSRSDYNLGTSPIGLPEGIGIYQSEELIAIIQGDITNLNLEASYFQDSIV